VINRYLGDLQVSKVRRIESRYQIKKTATYISKPARVVRNPSELLLQDAVAWSSHAKAEVYCITVTMRQQLIENRVDSGSWACSISVVRCSFGRLFILALFAKQGEVGGEQIGEKVNQKQKVTGKPCGHLRTFGGKDPRLVQKCTPRS